MAPRAPKATWLLVLSAACLVASAQAPEPVLINPVATCTEGKCVMTQKDFETLREFHSSRFQAMRDAAVVIDKLSAQNNDLLRQLARYGGGCRGNRA